MNTIEKALMHALFKEVFEYKGKIVAVIPNHPSRTDFEELSMGS